MIYPEGTRYNPELPHLIEKSKQFAIASGLFKDLSVYLKHISEFKQFIILVHVHVPSIVINRNSLIMEDILQAFLTF